MGIIGSTIKPFKATAFQAGKDFFDVSDSDVKGDWAVFFFYPADFTFVCPTELEDLAEQYDSLMLGDQLHTLSNNFGVLREEMGLADRATFVVDPDGVIQIMEITSEGVGRNAKELVRKIKAAQYVRKNPGQVCPAKWEEGSDTLAPSLELVGKI